MIDRAITRLVVQALEEDIGRGDITAATTIPEDSRCRARLMAKQDGLLSGIDVFREAFACVDADIAEWTALENGARFAHGDEVASFRGKTRSVLTAERTALNFLAHLSGVATLTAQYVAQLDGLDTAICDTRKTTPFLRGLEKRAVVHGGGANHRFNLADGVLIKENHIAGAGGIAQAVRRAAQGAHHLLKIEVEVTSLQEFEEALAAGADAIMLDNMAPDDMRQAVQRAADRPVVLEASGNASLENVRAMAEAGVDLISVGALTHSAPAVDFSLLIESE